MNLKKVTQNIILVFILGAEAMILIPRFTNSAKDTTNVFPELVGTSRAEVSMRQVTVVGRDQGQTPGQDQTYKLISPRLNYYQDSGEIMMDDIAGETFGADGKNYQISGRLAQILTEQSQALLQGDVVIIEPNQMELHSAQATHDWKQNIVRSSTVVNGYLPSTFRPTLEFRSLGMVYANKDKFADFSQDVWVKHNPVNKPAVVITSDSARLYVEERRVHFSGNVKMKREKITLTSRHADLRFQDKMVTYAEAYDDVVVEDPENMRHATAEKAELFADSRRIRLTGLPVLKIREDEVTGDIINLDQDSDTVEVERSSGKIDQKDRKPR